MSIHMKKSINLCMIITVVLAIYIFGLMNITEENIIVDNSQETTENELIVSLYPTQMIDMAVIQVCNSVANDVTKKDVNEEPKETKEEYIVTASILNIRESADINSNIIGTYQMNDVITVVDKNDVWLKTDKGYCHSDYLKLKTDKINIEGEKYIVSATLLNIRENPDINSRIIGTYELGERIIVVNKTGKWFKTDRGYCYSDYLTKEITKQYELVSRHVTTISSMINRPQSVYDSILVRSNLTAEHIEALIAGTALAGIGQAVVTVEELYGINCFVTLAVARLESANGTSKIARNKNNLFGLGAYDSNPYYHAFSFQTKEDSVYKFGQVIDEVYISNNRISLKSINEIYASSQTWSKKVYDVIQSDFKKINKIINE